MLVYFAVSQKPIQGKHRHGVDRRPVRRGSPTAQPDWIDRIVGTDEQVAAIWSGNTDPYVIWENEIFNRSRRSRLRHRRAR